MITLRAHLEALSAGHGPRPRGNILPAQIVSDHAAIGTALRTLARPNWAGWRDHGENPPRIDAPSRLLPPLP